MKCTLFILFLFFASNVHAQSEEASTLGPFQFLPNRIVLSNNSPTLSQSLIVYKTNKNLLFWVGSTLQSVKFNNAIEEFSAIAPFDARAFTPASFSEYSSQISNTHLLLDVHPARVW